MTCKKSEASDSVKETVSAIYSHTLKSHKTLFDQCKPSNFIFLIIFLSSLAR